MAVRERVVLSLGGSVVNPTYETGPVLDTEQIASIAEIILDMGERFDFGIVVGGGGTARAYISALRALGGSEADSDRLGILATRMNAMVVIEALKSRGVDVFPNVCEGHMEALGVMRSYSCVVMGGTVPGHTTDAVAALLCEYVGARRFVNLTNVDGVYDTDPKVNKSAHRIDEMDYEQLLSIVSKGLGAGANMVIDPLAALLLRRSSITCYVVNAKDSKAIRGAILGADSVEGTIIRG